METKGYVAASTIVGAITFTAGVAVGWWLIDRRYRRVFGEAIAEIENENSYLRDQLRDVEIEDNGISVSVKQEAIPHILAQVFEPIEEAVEPEVVQKHIFSDTSDDWDWEAERNHREKAQIYIIHKDEYMNDEMGYSQDSLTYYQGDQVLVDSLDKPIYNHTNFVGHDLRFGHGSDDPNVVYIRNEREKMEYEIILHTGYYLAEVEGLEVEEEYAERDLRHSVAPMKFRKE